MSSADPSNIYHHYNSTHCSWDGLVNSPSSMSLYMCESRNHICSLCKLHVPQHSTGSGMQFSLQEILGLPWLVWWCVWSGCSWPRPLPRWGAASPQSPRMHTSPGLPQWWGYQQRWELGSKNSNVPFIDLISPKKISWRGDYFSS